MPYRRSSKAPRRKTARSTWRKTAGTLVSQLSSNATKALKKKLGLNPESKNYDQSISAVALSTAAAGLIAPTVGLAQGATNNTRNGNGIRISHMTIRGWMNNGASATAQQIRLMVTYQPTLTTPGTTVTPAQLLQVSNDINSPYNSNLEGVKVIYDKRITLTPQQPLPALGFQSFKIKWSPSYDDGHVQWTDADTLGLQANLVKGSIYFWAMCSDPGPAPLVYAYCRTHYVDN